MIIVTDVKYIKVPEDRHTVSCMHPDAPIIINDGDIDKPVKAQDIQEEIIKGRRFKFPWSGNEVVIGMSVKTQEILELPFEAYDNMQESLNRCMADNTLLTLTLSEARTASLWKRIKWLFIGFK